MAIDMFRCPKCGNIVDEHNWTMVSDDDGFECMECHIDYSGEELYRLIENFENEIKPDNECSTFAD